MAYKTIAGIVTSKIQEDIIFPFASKKRGSSFIGEDSHGYDLLAEDWEDAEREGERKKD